MLEVSQNFGKTADVQRAGIFEDARSFFDPAELRHALEVFEALYLDHILLEESIAYPEAKKRLVGIDTIGMGREMARRRVMKQDEVRARP